MVSPTGLGEYEHSLKAREDTEFQRGGDGNVTHLRAKAKCLAFFMKSGTRSGNASIFVFYLFDLVLCLWRILDSRNLELYRPISARCVRFSCIMTHDTSLTLQELLFLIQILPKQAYIITCATL